MAIYKNGDSNGNSRNQNYSNDSELHLSNEYEESSKARDIRLKQEEMRQKALAFEQMQQRERLRRDEEELRRNPALAAERERKLTEMRAEEERLARIREDEQAKLAAERRVQEKKMDQTEALIASIRAQVEKEKAAKAAEMQKQAAASAGKKTTSTNSKPQFRTISPEELAKLEEKKRMKAAGIQPEKESSILNAGGGISGGLEGLGNGPTLANPFGDGPTLSNMNSGQESLGSSGIQGGGLGIDITASLDSDKSKSEESTIELNFDEINAAMQKTKEAVVRSDDTIRESSGTVGESGTIVLEDSIAWNDSNTVSTPEFGNVDAAKDSLLDENGDIISVIPMRQKSAEMNDVQSVYNIDFDDDDDDVLSFKSSSQDMTTQEEEKRKVEEEAKRRAEEEARRKAEEEARRQAEEEARRKAEEEARRKAEEEAKRQAEEEAKRQAEEEASRKVEQAAKVNNNDFALPVGAEQFLGKYLSVNAISDQIVRAIQYISEHPYEPRNMVILGQYGFGTTTIAEDFARSFYAMGICKTKTIAKIKAGALNRANISDAISKLQGGCLVIENAGVISTEKLGEIYQIVSNPDNDVVVIMTGQIETLSRIFKDNIVISTQFKHLIQVHRITDLDVFTIAKNHATKSGYPCEESAEKNLRKRMQEVESGNLDRVLKIVDNAVSKAHNREMTTGDQEHRLVATDFE